MCERLTVVGVYMGVRLRCVGRCMRVVGIGVWGGGFNVKLWAAGTGYYISTRTEAPLVDYAVMANCLL